MPPSITTWQCMCLESWPEHRPLRNWMKLSSALTWSSPVLTAVKMLRNILKIYKYFWPKQDHVLRIRPSKKKTMRYHFLNCNCYILTLDLGFCCTWLKNLSVQTHGFLISSSKGHNTGHGYSCEQLNSKVYDVYTAGCKKYAPLHSSAVWVRLLQCVDPALCLTCGEERAVNYRYSV